MTTQENTINNNIEYNFNRNIEKKNRKITAISLPNDISNVILPKYVVYHNECYNIEKNLWRDFFRIEKHPKINKPISSSKSSKINIKDKLKNIIDILTSIENKNLDISNNLIDNNEKPQDNSHNILLPKYISIKLYNNKKYLIYDKKIGNNRESLKILIPNDSNVEEYINIIQNKIKEKYN